MNLIPQKYNESLLRLFFALILKLSKKVPNWLFMGVIHAFYGLRDFIKTPKDRRYRYAAVLDLLLILVIVTNSIKPVSRFFSPLISSGNKHLSQLFHNKTTPEVFSFAPGLSRKIEKVDFAGLNYLSFFDSPLLEDGSINSGSYGYISFKNQGQDLLPKAHAYGTKVLLTITQMNNDTILSFLNNDQAKQDALTNITSEIKESQIDGVALAFEYQGDPGDFYRQKFTQFVESLTTRVHQEVPGAIVAVSLPDTKYKDSLFNLKEISRLADKVFMIAESFAAPEVKNLTAMTPVYGSNSGDYWGKVSESINNFLESVPSNKLVAERAWYGNGDNYPMYVPSSTPVEQRASQEFRGLDPNTLEELVAGVPDGAKNAARRNIPYIAKALADEGILNVNVLAYALATIEHETAGTFEPIEEFYGRASARRLGYEGGESYFGRGFIQLTHLRNYRLIGQRIGMGDELAKHPELASKPDTAAKILAAFFADNNVANLASQGAYVAARNPVNPDRNGWAVANLAFKYESNEIDYSY